MLTLLVAHLVAAAAAPQLVRVFGRWAFLGLALVPFAAFGWALSQTNAVVSGAIPVEVVTWVPVLDLHVALSLTTLQWLLMLLVTGVGALVLAYCAWYFTDDEPGLRSFAGTLTGFAGAMLGLVIADDLLVLYVFWELTTVFSYLLIGHDPTKRASRNAGTQALIVTTFGGLAMLVGFLMLGVETGTLRISELLADPPTGTTATVAIGLVLVGAISKSALLPLHFWLPGAMVAPTPVSAYLHAAAMVKAGVFLVALFAPAFAGVPGWRPIVLTAGVLTMLVGGWRALRQVDIKLLLAYGTVSQLGFLLAAVGIGTRSAALAGLAMVTAHALFKAALFLIVGIVDRCTGTRDLRVLSGVGRALPVVAVAAVVAGASMAGLPPLLGFVAKEGVFAALLDVAADGDGTGIGTTAGWLVVVGVVVGSGLTVAYTARFLWGAFGSKSDGDPTAVDQAEPGFISAPVVLAALSLILGFLGPSLTRLLTPYADQFPAGRHEPELALWHGLGPALAMSGATLAIGLLLFAGRSGFNRLQARLPAPFDAERGYHSVVRSLDRSAVEVTGFAQRGSVGFYLSVVLVVVVLLPGSALLSASDWSSNLVWWDTAAQLAAGVVIVIAAVLTARARRRLKAVVLLGVTGYGTAVLFLLHGAPDLALTQVLVETVTLVIFVLVLRRLPRYFSDRPLTRNRYWRMAIGALVGLACAGFMIVSTQARTAEPVSIDYPREAVEYGGGNNVVNVILVDIRAWDTMGEIAVLVVAATGVASLLFIQTRVSSIRRVYDIPQPESVPAVPTAPGRSVWLPGSRTLAPDRRSIIFEVITRLTFHTIIAFSLYLLFSGHNNPGGGFAAGLVTGVALMIRYLAGGRYELDEAAPIDAGTLLGAGLFIATGSGLVPLAFGGTVLQSAVIDFTVPLLGEVHLVTSLFFDLGVYLVVVGLMVDLLRSLGSGIDRHILREQRAGTPAEPSGVST